MLHTDPYPRQPPSISGLNPPSDHKHRAHAWNQQVGFNPPLFFSTVVLVLLPSPHPHPHPHPHIQPNILKKYLAASPRSNATYSLNGKPNQRTDPTKLAQLNQTS
ncbi:hypothetical protein K435DRAFT_880157 [Dendrothele bispora CBS 962.96]|uniref:Uncharacterized protein n=1 Tax=Dendrothele bispora (strain CBS 962.96) TaxID=1314807 RepID=A0A4S8KJZ5_DENBC|nr:hypothetical protein K435DRAFT_880157 [Dendrothele bispora CBS 962.96]